MSEDNDITVTELRLSSLEEFKRDQQLNNLDIQKSLVRIELMLQKAVSSACPNPGRCIVLDNEFQLHKQSMNERFARIETRSDKTDEWRESIELQLSKLTELFNRGIGILSFIALVAAPIIMWALQRFFPGH